MEGGHCDNLRAGLLAVFITVPYVACVDKKREYPDFQVDPHRIAKARTALLKWHVLHGRHDLPWRTSDPYGVLVSEFMLQQTTVATVIPRFQDWMNRFPTVSDLAQASEQQVLSAWEGLGYYSRARRLQEAARRIMELHAGVIPLENEALLNLPGVGSYTAAAIIAFAHDQPAVVLDTNIIRVLARWWNNWTPIDTAEGRKLMGYLGSDFFPQSGCRSVASALMDLGATLCQSGSPVCSACPLKKTCHAFSPEKLPLKAPRPVITKVNEHRAWYQKDGRLFLKQSSGPRWRGLWILPELNVKKPAGRCLAQITYPITRYRVTMKVFPISGEQPEGLQGFDTAQLSTLPMPTPHRKVIKQAIHEGRLPRRP